MIYERYRESYWANPNAYARVVRTDGGRYGPWLHLFDRPSQEALGEPTPQALIGWDVEGMEPYSGPLDPDDTSVHVQSSQDTES